MNTETYKVAKEILDKYGPAEQLKPREPISFSNCQMMTVGGLN